MSEILAPFKQKSTLRQIGLCALVFVGMAVPFKVMVLVEGFTEVRPVNAVPVVLGLLFGPIGAWGCAIGNLISDFFGTFSAASCLGFLGNFIAAYLPYKLWHTWRKEESPNVKSGKNLALYALISVISALTVAVFIACGLDICLGLWMPDVFWIIFFNNLAFPLVIGLPVFIILTGDDFKIKTYISASKDTKIRKISLGTLLTSQIIILVMIKQNLTMSGSKVMAFMGALYLISLIIFLIYPPNEAKNM